MSYTKQESKQWRVYDITEYVDLHPGGPAIMRNAGGDATKGFYGVQHAGRALEMIEEYQCGILTDYEELEKAQANQK